MRVVNRLLTLLLALGIAAAGVVTLVEIALAALGEPYWLIPWRTWRRWALNHPWTSTTTQISCYALCALSLTLLVLAFAPHRALSVEARSDSSDLTTDIRLDPLEASLARTAEAVDGVASATARVSRRWVRVIARSNRRDVNGLKNAVTQAVGHRLDRLHLLRQPQLRVQVRSRTQ